MRHVIAAVAFMAAATFGTAVLAQGKQDFELINQTGYDISEVYVSAAKTDDWEEDVLGRDILDNGETLEISFDRGTKSCKWDLKVVYDDDDSSAIWYDFDLCQISSITIHYDRKKDVTSATTR